MLELKALLSPEYFDGDSADYFNKFMEDQAKKLEEYRRLKAEHQRQRAEAKAKLA